LSCTGAKNLMRMTGRKDKNMSDTPRTEQACGFCDLDTAVPADFARELERDLNAKDQQLSALRLVCGTTDGNKFETALDRANARIAELEKDKARLDWLEAAPKSNTVCSFNKWYGGNDTYRQAIDAAMKGTQ
jgi:hypothetical protein